MPRNLADLSEAERADLLHGIWTNMVNTEIANGNTAAGSIAAPVTASGPVPPDLASHLAPFVSPSPTSGLAAHAWRINNCVAPPRTTER
jgi:hypothetical protein